MKRSYKDLREFITTLESNGELIRIKHPVSRDLELAEITDRVSKSKNGGKALLFENVNGSTMPVLINAYGSYKRMAMSMGSVNIDDAAKKIEYFLSMQTPPKMLSHKIKLAGELLSLANIAPKMMRGSAPCQEIVSYEPDLDKIPILQCWPKDGGRFITLPAVISKDPETGTRNVGVYRMHVYDKKTTGMHWQTQKDGAAHTFKSRRLKKRVPVAVALGCDPATSFCGVVPLPYGLDEFLFSGFLRGNPVELVKCKSIDLEVPAHSEIVLEGYVDPEDMRPEGPFGDHTGVYTPVELFPTFHIQCITMRRDPIYLTTIVGKPPMEDYYMGKAIEKTFLPIIRKQITEIVDMNFPMEGTFNNAVIVSIDKTYPFAARKVAHALWGLGQLAYTKVIILVDKHVNVHDLSAVTLQVFNNIDPKRDVFFVEGPVDSLNHASDIMDYGSKMGIDATAKLKEEGFKRVWPDEIEMDEKTKKRIDQVWSDLGITNA